MAPAAGMSPKQRAVLTIDFAGVCIEQGDFDEEFRRPAGLPKSRVAFTMRQLLSGSWHSSSPSRRRVHRVRELGGLAQHPQAYLLGDVRRCDREGGGLSPGLPTFKPGFDLAEERQKRLESGLGEFFNAHDLYADARPCLLALKEAGYVVGIAGNQTKRAGQLLQELNLAVDFVMTSDDLGAEKPDVGLFHKLIDRRSLEAASTVYVGDRYENDILPAQKAGLRGVLLRRGPWANINEQRVEANQAAGRIASLEELPRLLEQLRV
jgi:HAD superfamily hydrolase (TIGR01549 family)